MIQIEKMIREDRADCCGCTSCWNACPTGALDMVEDAEGFLYPKVNTSKCVECELCSQSCPSLHYNAEMTPVFKTEAFAAINPDEAVRKKSSSGGIFYLLAEYVLKHNGVVFGAGFNSEWEVCHYPVNTIEKLNLLQGSKYVQSRIGDTFRKVRNELLQGKLVLFSGTPCQCTGLTQYLQRDYENLLLVDFICHGVPSPRVWRDYVVCRVGEGGRKEISEISFRNKNLSWERYLLTFRLRKVNKYLAADLHHDLFLKGFLQNLYLRPSCHHCKFCTDDRVSDITLADYWGVAQDLPEMYDGKGTSVCFLHSEKAKAIFLTLGIRKMKATFKKVVDKNPCYLHPALPSPHRAEFFAQYKNSENLCQLIRLYTRPPLRERCKEKLRSVPGMRMLARIIKKIGGGLS